MSQPEDVTLEDKVAVVTGAAAGIGAAVALAFARFGADLAVCDRNGDDLARVVEDLAATGRRVCSGVFDVRDREAASTWIADVATRFGGIDILVNNAGGTFRAPFTDVNAKGEAALIAENYTQLTGMIRDVLPVMREGGSIINVTSIEAHRGAPDFSTYAAMKAAVTNLSRTLALELADHDVRVNVIAPDAVRTPGHAGLERDVARSPTDGESRTPLRRVGTPADCAGAAVFLATPLSRFVTGTVIHVDGGNDAARGWRRAPDGTWIP